MINRIRTALAKKAGGDEGFTLIELLVVVIIIGILAAIAIPIFLNQKGSAYEATVKSDLRNFSGQMETFLTQNGAYPTTAADLNAMNLQVSKANDYTFFVTGTGATAGYVIFGKNSNSAQEYYVSSYSGTTPQKFTGTRPTALTAAMAGIGGGNPAVAAVTAVVDDAGTAS